MLNKEYKISHLELDEYGEWTEVIETENSIKGLLTPYTYTLTSDIRYKDATYTLHTYGLLNTNDLITDGINKYKVLYVMPSKRLNTIYLCLV